MHYFALVVIPPSGGDVEEQIIDLMAPYREQDWPGGWWDWWQVGGRWTGEYSDYDPETDPANKGDDPLLNDGVKWPTQWVKHPGDIMNPKHAWSAITAGARPPYTMVMPEWFGHKEEWKDNGIVETPGWRDEVLRRLELVPQDWRVVIVDYHS